MTVSVINIEKKFKEFDELHRYKIIAQMNDYLFKLVRMKREFVWHKHVETDEVFIVVDGRLRIDLRDKYIQLEKGEMVVIPKGVEHKPSSTEECKIMLIEPADTVNTGNAGGELTDTSMAWI